MGALKLCAYSVKNSRGQLMSRYRLEIDIDDSAQDIENALIDELTELMRSDILSACEVVCYCGQVH